MDFDYHWDGKLLSLLSGYEIVSKDLHQSYRSHQHHSIAERHTIHLQMIINSKTDCTNISHIRTHILFQICQNLCLRIMKLLILLYHFCLCGILLIFPSDAAQSAHILHIHRQTSPYLHTTNCEEATLLCRIFSGILLNDYITDFWYCCLANFCS